MVLVGKGINRERDKQWEDSGGVLKVELPGYAKGLGLQCEMKEESETGRKSWK